ncbi:adenylosuccinate synthetase [Nocardia jinanensis]|uniref:Adenylosuccinate synthetase n=1 Tax=Nocardia jinanensis TaxID=382504 RepID=A0A917RCK5_9NOCA|nr:adenylosuccinate synthetase [Nocardia jinanensis]GGL01316.1 adenylosuccinate synthetase [Nocardia jinanensis]
MTKDATVTDRHLIVVDLGFGDAGKGATVDWLCSPEAGLGVSAVVRFNGGAQAAHNVVADGRHHTFAQFGSGTFAGVPTLISQYVLVEPLALAAEAERLARTGVADPLSLLSVDGRALLTTPIHIAANRAREDARGAGRHGSCGRGIGETAAYALGHDAPRVADCRTPAVLRRKLRALAAHYRPLLASSTHHREPIDALLAAYREFGAAVRITGAEELRRAARRGRLVFEGAQGVLLDEWRGFHPHTTWSTVEPRNARALLAGIGAHAATLGVTRAYMTRHGAGPFPTEDPDLRNPEPHNGVGRYQGAFRQGHLDTVLLRYAVAVCGGVDGLVVNHLDAPAERAATAYATPHGVRTSLEPGSWQDLDHQRALTEYLTAATPLYTELPTDVAGWLQRHLGIPAVLTASGPDRRARRASVSLEAALHPGKPATSRAAQPRTA